MGAPVVTLEFSVDKPVAQIALRLNEVRPDGYTSRVCYKVLNLTHRDSHESPKALEPGKRYRVRLQLRDTAHRFSPGNRIRVALSTAYWPFVWPSPEAVTLTVYAGKSELELPVRPPRTADARLHVFNAPPPAPTRARGPGQAVAPRAPVAGDQDQSGRVSTWDAETGKLTRTTASERSLEVFEITDDDPSTAKVSFNDFSERTDQGRNLRLESRLEMSATREDFILVGKMTAFENGKEVFTRNWNRKIRRNLV